MLGYAPAPAPDPAPASAPAPPIAHPHSRLSSMDEEDGMGSALASDMHDDCGWKQVQSQRLLTSAHALSCSRTFLTSPLPLCLAPRHPLILQVQSDVFRWPGQAALFCALIGSGVQVGLLALFSRGCSELCLSVNAWNQFCIL
jgi:hypothetical protein